MDSISTSELLKYEHSISSANRFLGSIFYRKDVDDLDGKFLIEYEPIHLKIELTDRERTTYDEEYQMYRDYVDNHDHVDFCTISWPSNPGEFWASWSIKQVP